VLPELLNTDFAIAALCRIAQWRETRARRRRYAPLAHPAYCRKVPFTLLR